jgi:hypothetical protein
MKSNVRREIILPISSRWVLSSLKILNKLDWIDPQRLKSFILACQDGPSFTQCSQASLVTDPSFQKKTEAFPINREIWWMFSTPFSVLLVSSLLGYP